MLRGAQQHDSLYVGKYHVDGDVILFGDTIQLCSMISLAVIPGIPFDIIVSCAARSLSEQGVLSTRLVVRRDHDSVHAIFPS